MVIADSLRWTAFQTKPPWGSSDKSSGDLTRRSAGYNKEFDTAYFEGAMCIVGGLLFLAGMHAAMPVTLQTPVVSHPD